MYEYDARGNLIKDPEGNEYEYDYENRLIEITGPKGKFRYIYNGAGSRIGVGEYKDFTWQWRYYIGDLLEINNEGIVDKSHVIAGGRRIASITPEKYKYFFHVDHLGSTRLITDQNGNAVKEFYYEPFGKLTANIEFDYSQHQFMHQETGTLSLSPTIRAYTGQKLDGSGLMYYRARYYNPDLGKFMQADPIVQNPLFSQSFNRYSYVFNNPMNFIDPTGYKGCLPGTPLCIDNTGGGDINDYSPNESSLTTIIRLITDAFAQDSSTYSTSTRVVNTGGRSSGANSGNYGNMNNGGGANRHKHGTPSHGSNSYNRDVAMGATAVGLGSQLIPVVGDGIAFGASVVNLVVNPSWDSAVDTGLDFVGIFPGIPAMGTIRRASKLADMLDTVNDTERISKAIKVRKKLGKDKAESFHIIEKQGNETISITHRVKDQTENIIHQHQTHIGKYKTNRQFPDEWIEYPDIGGLP